MHFSFLQQKQITKFGRKNVTMDTISSKNRLSDIENNKQKN